MDVKLPDGTVVRNVPDNITRAELTAKLQSNGYDVSQLGMRDKSVPDSAPPEQKKEEKPLIGRIADQYKGYRDAALTLASGATSGAVGFVGGALGGLAGSVAIGKFGTKEGAEEVGRVASEYANKLTYKPTTQEGRDAVEAIGKVLEPLGALGPMALPMAQPATTAGQDARVVASQAQQGMRDLRGAIPSKPEMAGMGSANTAQEAMRRQRAADLPAPIELTKGQASRDFAQQQFEREAAKNPNVGEPLRQRFSDQNKKILQNFDAWIDQTGAEGGSLRATGQVVTDALVQKSNRAKAEIRAAYEKAKESGAMQERVEVAPLEAYLEQHKPEAINAPVLSSVEAKLGYVAKGGTASINDLEEVRKMVGRLGSKDATNAIFAKEVKGLLDEMTDGHGGDLYRKARGLRERYGREFNDHAVIDRLLDVKPGTKDRAVAYEDVFSHSILKGSLDDVRTVRKVLQTAGPQGEQAWKELQGATLQHIKDEITKNVQIDASGNQVISPARLNRLVAELDKDGKLDFVFGKQGAQQIRDVNGIAQDVLTSPPGAVNHSNTASILTGVLDKVASKFTGVPFVGSATGYVSRELKDAGARRRVRDSLSR